MRRKKLVFRTEICDYFQNIILKIGLFERVKKLFKPNQFRYGVFPKKPESNTKRIFGIACVGKKLVFHTDGNLRISRIKNFKNRSFSSGQEFLQIEPISVWSIPCAPRVWNKKNFWYSLSGKKVRFSYGKSRIYTNFANKELQKIGPFSWGQGLVQSTSNPEWSIQFVPRC